MAGKNTVLLSDIHYDNPFMKGFLRNVYLRPSCYRCKCKNGVSHSDLTIGDFWGIDRISKEFDDDKGVSMLLILSDKGESVIQSIEMDKEVFSLDTAKLLNGGFKERQLIPSKRKWFFKQFNKKCELKKLIIECSKLTFISRIINKINYLKQKTI